MWLLIDCTLTKWNVMARMRLHCARHSVGPTMREADKARLRAARRDDGAPFAMVNWVVRGGGVGEGALE